MRRGLVMLVPIEHALLRRMRIEHPGLGAVELRPVIRTFRALDIGRRNAAEHRHVRISPHARRRPRRLR